MRLKINRKAKSLHTNSTHSTATIETKWSPDIAKCGHTSLPNILLIGYKQLGMTPPEFLTLTAILSYKWDERKPHPSIKTICTLTASTPRTARKHIASLEKKGLLQRVGRSYQTNEYDFSPLTDKLDKLAKDNLPHGQDIPEGTVSNDREPLSGVTAKEDTYKEDSLNKNSTVSGDTTESSKQIQQVYDNFIKQFDTNSNQLRLTAKRKAKIRARLKDCGYEMLTRAIENVAANGFYRGDNDRGWKADLDFITRSYEQVEKLSQLSSKELTFKADW